MCRRTFAWRNQHTETVDDRWVNSAAGVVAEPVDAGTSPPYSLHQAELVFHL